MATAIDDVLDDLRDEYERLDVILAALTAAQWGAASGAAGWTVTDVVAHLALTEETVVTTLQRPDSSWNERDRALDDVLHEETAAAAMSPGAALDRWRAATAASLVGLRAADPEATFRWAAAPLRPRTLATTRLAEHWAHGLDITEPLGIDFADTDRLRHIAWLGHATIPYALRLAGRPECALRVELVAPSGRSHAFGPEHAADRVSGPMGAFCRVGARRLAADVSGLQCAGPRAHEVLALLRNYAG